MNKHTFLTQIKETGLLSKVTYELDERQANDVLDMLYLVWCLGYGQNTVDLRNANKPILFSKN